MIDSRPRRRVGRRRGARLDVTTSADTPLGRSEEPRELAVTGRSPPQRPANAIAHVAISTARHASALGSRQPVDRALSGRPNDARPAPAPRVDGYLFAAQTTLFDVRRVGDTSDARASVGSARHHQRTSASRCAANPRHSFARSHEILVKSPTIGRRGTEFRAGPCGVAGPPHGYRILHKAP
jgi:hypothetical protein